MGHYTPRAAFVLLWSSGFVAGAIGTDHAPALALTTYRFALAAAVLAVLARAAGVAFPRDRATLAHLAVIGLLLQAVQFGGGYLGLAAGTPAALSALIFAACPLVVGALAVPLFGERPPARVWAGMVLGFGGVVLAVADHLGTAGPQGIALTVVGLVGFAGGTLYQRRFALSVDLRAGGAISLAVAAVAVAPAAALDGGLRLPGSAAALGALAWLTVVNSVVAMSLLLWLLRRGGAAATTSLLYLVPPVTALLGALVLGQPLDGPVIAALAISGAGVALATAQPRSRRATVVLEPV